MAEATVQRSDAAARVAALWAWARRHVLRGPLDALLTLGALAVLAAVGVPLVEWLLTGAQWGVIVENRHLLLVGRYPAAELWRVWLLGVLLLALAGLSAGLAGRWGRRAWAAMALAGAAALALRGAGPSAWGLPAGWLALAGGYALAAWTPLGRTKGLRPAVILGWGGFGVATLVLLHGFEGSAALPAVGTNRWGGFLLTALLTGVGILASFPIGVALALGRRGRLPVIRWTCVAYIELIRAVPLITVLFMGQLLIPLFLPPDWAIDNLIRVMVAVTGFSAAYMAENVRGGLQAVPRGQMEAAQALGLGVAPTTFLIVLPQALRNVIPAIVGQCIALFKDTSLVTIIGLVDLLAAGQATLAQAEFGGREAEVYLFVAAVYWVFSFNFSRLSQRLERRLGVGQR